VEDERGTAPGGGILNAMPARARHMTPPAVDVRRPGLVWPVRIDPAGLDGPTRAQARGERWVRVTQGLYLPAGLDPALAVDQRIVTAAALLPAGGAITGWAALRWLGVRYLDGTRHRRRLPVPAAIGIGHIRQRDHLALTTESHLLCGAREVDGLTVSRPLAATSHAVRHATSLEEAVGVIDRVAASDLVAIDELIAYAAAQLRGTRNVSRIRAAAELADENSWSPPETMMRLQWRTIGITNVVCNRPVFDRAGTFLGTPDLLDLDSGLVGEYDGAHHLAGSQRSRDIRREAMFRRAGLEYVEMVAADLSDPTDFDRRTLQARERTSVRSRAWTIDPPPNWVPTHTVALRRALPPEVRDRFLSWQKG
jgi:hypothetical protein